MTQYINPLFGTPVEPGDELMNRNGEVFTFVRVGRDPFYPIVAVFEGGDPEDDADAFGPQVFHLVATDVL